MNGWLKRGALALVLGALCTMSGAALAQPAGKPAILTPPGKDKAAAAKDDKGKPAEAGKPEEAGAKGDEKGKGDEKADKDKDGGTDSDAAAAPAEDEKAKEARAAKRKEKKEARKAKAKEARADVKKKVEALLKGQPMAAALKEELKRHARRLARLERAKDVAEDASDTETVGRIDKLIAKENARHDKWMAGYNAKAAGGDKDKAGAK